MNFTRPRWRYVALLALWSVGLPACRRRSALPDAALVDVVRVDAKPPRAWQALSHAELRPSIERELPTTDPFTTPPPPAPGVVPLPPSRAPDVEEFGTELVDPMAGQTDGGSAPIDEGPTQNSVLANTPAEYHCSTISERSRCLEHTATSLERLRGVTNPVSVARTACATSGGTLASGGCPTAGLVGSCVRPEGTIERFYSRGRAGFRAASAQTECSLTTDSEFVVP